MSPGPTSREPLPTTFSRWRIVRFRTRQTLAWWLQVKLQRPLAWTLVHLGLAIRGLGFRRKGLSLLLSGRRVTRNSRADNAIRDIIAQDPLLEEDLVAMFGESASQSLSACAGRTLVVKVPRLQDGEVVEKGALVIKFTETFAPMFTGLDTRRLARYFRIILEPSWVGYSLPEILVWTGLSPEKVIVMAPYQPDFDFLTALDSNLVPVTLGPADWVNPTRFRKLEGVPKVYDAIYVANYNPKKRVDRYLRAIVRVCRRRPGFRAALVCAGVGKNDYGQAIGETIAWAKENAAVDFFNPVSQARLNELLNQSKVNVLLSLREGMNKGLAEGLFAGTPALLLAESACGNHRHINPETGRVVPDRGLEKALCWFADHDAEFEPHVWARKQIAPQVSMDRLSNMLRDLEVSEGRAWTLDLAPKTNQPEMRYIDSSNHAMLELRGEMLQAFAKDAGDARIGELHKRFTEIVDR